MRCPERSHPRNRLEGATRALPAAVLLTPDPGWWTRLHVVVIGSVLLAAFLAVVLLLTADRWLVAGITWLDNLLTRMGFGTWMAGFITRMEMRIAEKKRRKEAGRMPK